MLVYKLLHDMKHWIQTGVLDIEDVVLQAVAAKNALIRRAGYSAQYLATGNNTFFDSLEEESLPQLSQGDRVEQAAARFELRRAAQTRCFPEASKSRGARSSVTYSTAGSREQADH
jgi:hypothetical protein